MTPEMQSVRVNLLMKTMCDQSGIMNYEINYANNKIIGMHALIDAPELEDTQELLTSIDRALASISTIQTVHKQMQEENLFAFIPDRKAEEAFKAVLNSTDSALVMVRSLRAQVDKLVQKIKKLQDSCT